MRRICSHCKEPVTYPPKMYQDLAIDPGIMDGITLYRGRGCERCKNSGYAGRLAIIEAMTISDEIRKLIIARSNTREMGKVAVGQGMRTLRNGALDAFATASRRSNKSWLSRGSLKSRGRIRSSHFLPFALSARRTMSKTALLFAGQGAQVVGWAKISSKNFPPPKRGSIAPMPRLGYNLSTICFQDRRLN